jgi:hypothetical protein
VPEGKHILTIATGKEYYINLAVNLALSFLYWHPNGNITFQLVTDLPDQVPGDVRERIQIIPVNPGELGTGFTPKLHLDKLVSEGQTFFIDSDCLIFEKLDRLFERFKGHDVSVVGNYTADGEWFGDTGAICRQFNIPCMPKFNGGLYYLEKGANATAVYTTARELESRYDEIGFVRLRNRPNDEVLMALAMQLHGQTPVIDDGTIMSDPQAYPGGYKIDVIKGDRWLINPPAPHPLHQSWNPHERVSPVIVHFLGHFTNHYPYKREVSRLWKKMNNKLDWIKELFILLKIEYPERIKIAFKDTFRPIYHQLFGTRNLKKSERI